ncbi:MAG TPA: glycosyltransferase [Chthoniobacterales bacterium]|nr:glycosyltransferase [Chthoniobacterales bacterium]
MKIHVWVPDYSSGTGGIQTLSRFAVRAIREIWPDARILVLSKNDASYPDMQNEAADEVRVVGWWPQRLRTAAFAVELILRAAKDRPDWVYVAHANFAPVAAAVRKLFGTRFVVVANGIEVWKIQSRLIRSALRTADRLLPISEFTRQRLAAELQISSGSMPLFPCTFDADTFLPSPKPRFLLKRYGLREDQPIILTISRLASAERYKGYDQVLHSLPLLRDRFPHIRYILGGRGPDRARVEALIDALGLRENVILAGFVPDHELRSHYNLCDVFAMPSKGEGFGIVFLEAAGCGKPVLAGNKDGSVDAVLGGRTGAVVDPDDIQQIQTTLLQLVSGTHSNGLLRDPTALRSQVIDAFGFQRFTDRLHDIVAPLVNCRPVPALTP